ncbi:hypothetical protein H2200_011711 [Cladophialophora chaetospira]|uniref:Uncharacterized protein n=1 Tax=Cladophialophora chaetospira TaxID=386627 RepID=A0AA38WYK8_9EURO|nr:hypothetical protein H2200_011711 [Cladophialophora chaetospira]
MPALTQQNFAKLPQDGGVKRRKASELGQCEEAGNATVKLNSKLAVASRSAISVPAATSLSDGRKRSIAAMTDASMETDAEHSNNGFPPSPSTASDPQTTNKSMPIPDHSQPASPDPQASPGRQSRPSGILNRISFGRTKGIKELALEDLEKRRQAQKTETKARKDAASQERKTRQDQEKRDREESRKASKERAKQSKEDKAKRKADERKVKDFYGIRGYDPNAGMLPSGREHGIERNQVTEKTRESPSTEARSWGIEFGKPKHHEGKGHFSGHHENCGEQYGRRAAANGGSG